MGAQLLKCMVSVIIRLSMRASNHAATPEVNPLRLILWPCTFCS